jgi:hypothetical protein
LKPNVERAKRNDSERKQVTENTVTAKRRILDELVEAQRR